MVHLLRRLYGVDAPGHTPPSTGAGLVPGPHKGLPVPVPESLLVQDLVLLNQLLLFRNTEYNAGSSVRCDTSSG